MSVWLSGSKVVIVISRMLTRTSCSGFLNWSDLCDGFDWRPLLVNIMWYCSTLQVNEDFQMHFYLTVCSGILRKQRKWLCPQSLVLLGRVLVTYFGLKMWALKEAVIEMGLTSRSMGLFLWAHIFQTKKWWISFICFNRRLPLTALFHSMQIIDDSPCSCDTTTVTVIIWI